MEFWGSPVNQKDRPWLDKPLWAPIKFTKKSEGGEHI